MNDQDKSREQLIAELVELRQRIADAGAGAELSAAAALLHVAPLGIHVCDCEGRITFVNPSQEAITGYTADELVGTYAWDRIVPGPDKDFLPAYFKHLVTEQPAPTPYCAQNIRKNGELFDVRIDWNYIRNLQGQVKGFVSIVTDITQQKQAETALQESEERFRKVFEEGPLGVVLAGLDLGIQHVNKRLCDMLGYSEDETIGLGIRGISHPDDWEKDRALGARVVRGEIPQYTIEKRYVRRDGQVFWGQLTVSMMHDAKGRPTTIIGMIEDITQRKRAEEALQKAHDELERRVEERTAELRQANELLQAEVELRQRVEEELKAEQRAIRRMLMASDQERRLLTYEIHDGPVQQLVGALLLFQSPTLQKVWQSPETEATYRDGVAALLHAQLELRRVMNSLRTPVLEAFGVVDAIEDVAGQLRSAPGAPEIECRDDVQFKRLEPTLENTLFRIAQEAMTNACRHSKGEKVRVTLTQKGDDVTLEVRDWGIGFDQDGVQENRFGLEGIRERARILGGKLTITSEPGKGTVVRAKFPVVEVKAE